MARVALSATSHRSDLSPKAISTGARGEVSVGRHRRFRRIVTVPLPRHRAAQLRCRRTVTRETRLQSLLERLRRRLRELGHPARDVRDIDDVRQAGRADVGEAPQRRTELRPSHDQQLQNTRAAIDQATLPQQPPAPGSSRTRTAVFARPRKATSEGQPASIFGPTTTESVSLLRVCGTGDNDQRKSPFELEPGLVDHPRGQMRSGVFSVASHWETRPPDGGGPLHSSSPTSPGALPLASEPTMPALAGALLLSGAASLELVADRSSTSGDADPSEPFAAPAAMAHRLP